MFAPRHSLYAVGLTVLVLAGAAACTDATTGASRHAISLSLTTASAGALASRSPTSPVSGGVSIDAGASTLALSRAELVARRIELAPASAADCAGVAEAGDDHGSSSDGCAELESGPTLLDLPLDASTKTNISAAVPAGSYRALEIRIGPVTSGNSRSAAFRAAHPELQGVSVRVEGTFNGKAFVFTSAVDARMELSFAPPVVVDAANPNVTVAIDLARWFSDGAGGTLDPGDPANAARISANITGSFRAFEDDDHDGHEDHH